MSYLVQSFRTSHNDDVRPLQLNDTTLNLEFMMFQNQKLYYQVALENEKQ